MPLKGRGRLPSLATLQSLSPEKLVELLGRFGLAPDIREINRRGQRAYARLDDVLAEGLEPDDATWAAIDSAIEREATAVLRQQAKRAVRNYRLDQLSGAARDFVWIAVLKGSCPSCEDRHGRSRTLAEWRREGLPGSTALLCARECRCTLQPDVVAERIKGEL